jgi:hypothetical protein
LSAALVLTAAFAGCADDAPDAPLVPDAAPAGPRDPLVTELPFSFTATADFVVNGVVVGPGEWPFWRIGEGPPVDVTLVAEWTCASVVCPLRMILWNDDDAYAEASGESPLVLELPASPAGIHDARFFATSPGVAVAVSGTMTITMAFSSDP